MRKLSAILFSLLLGLNVMAEDILQVVPFSTRAGIQENDWEESFSINMNNTLQYTALQFDLYLPEGMTLIDDGPFDFNSDRFPGRVIKKVWYPNHDIDITNPESGHYFVKVYNAQLETIDGTEGELFSVYYLTSEDMKPGYYPIRIEGLCLAVTGRPEDGTRVSASISYVKIGEPEKNVVYDLGEGIVPTFVESEMTDVENIVVNSTCQSLVLTDGYSFTAPGAFTAAKASYSRNMGTTWGTICLPYTVISDENAAYYGITSVENDVLTLTKYDELPAGTPALVKKLAGEGISLQATSVDVCSDINNVAGSVNMYGSYTNQTRVEDPTSYYIYNDKFYSCNEYFFCNAFRAYFTMEGAGAKMLHIADVDDVVTAIDALTGDGVEAIYGEDGIQRNDIEKGMNIVKLSNGKTQKIIIK